MAIFGLWVCPFFHVRCSKPFDYEQIINKAGGLVYQRNFAGKLETVSRRSAHSWD